MPAVTLPTGADAGGEPLPNGEESVLRRRRLLRSPWLWGLLIWAFALRVWFGSAGLHAGRFWDERFGLANIESFLRTGSLWPVNAFHPTLAYLPQALLLGAAELLHRVTGDPRFAVLQGGGIAPLGYLLCRLSQAVFGVLSLLALARLGERVFDRAVGLTAALLFAVTHWHLRQSVIYKPDILLMLLSILAVAWAVEAVAAPSARRFAVAGVGVGLAMASKYNAAPLGVALAVGALLRRQPDWRRRLLWLFGAGAVCVGLFLALNPHLMTQSEMFRRDFGATLRDYSRKGARTSKPAILLHAGQVLAGPDYHGPVIASLALLGAVWIVVRAVRAEERRRAVLATLLAFPPVYVVLYALVTTNPSPHNWLPLLPFSALCAAFALVEGWRWATARLPAIPKRTLTAVAAAALGAWGLVIGTTWVYRAMVPSTWGGVEPVLQAAVAGNQPRYVVVSGDIPMTRARTNRPRWVVELSSEQWEARKLPRDWSDFEVYRQGRFDPPAPDGAEAAGARTLVEPRLFQSQGPPLLLISHPWRLAGPPVKLTRDGDTFLPPQIADSQLVSFVLELPRKDRVRVRMSRGDVGLPLAWVGRKDAAQHFVTMRVGPGTAPLRVEGVAPERIRRVRAFVWER